MFPWFVNIYINGKIVDSQFTSSRLSLEVEDNGYDTSTFKLKLGVSKNEVGEWQFLADDRFKPLNNIIITAGFDAENGAKDYLIDGYITVIKHHIDNSETDSYIEISGKDSTYLMNLEEKVKTWSNVSDSEIAETIFSSYGLESQIQKTYVRHEEDDHTIIQRGTDIQFLRTLALRNGFECYVDKDIISDKKRGIFKPLQLDLTPQKDLAVHFGNETNVTAFDAQIDVSRPLKVEERQIDTRKKSINVISATDVDITKLGDKNLKDLTEATASSFGITPAVLLSSSVTSNPTELKSHSTGILNTASWFISVQGEIDSLKYASILKSNKPVNIKGVSSNLNGKYYVVRVIHHFSFGSSPNYIQFFEAKKNAIS